MQKQNQAEFIDECEEELKPLFKRIDSVAYLNTQKVLSAFNKNRVALRHFSPTTGYGYGDDGRDNLNRVFADIFNTDAAIVSPSIASGTHALSLCLYGVLRPGDFALSITGKPYDTLHDVLYGEANGSLKDFNIGFEAIDLKNDNIDFDSVKKRLEKSTPKIIYLQRSRGYEWRDSLTVDDIAEACQFIRRLGYDGCIMVDNCYGEFAEEREPTDAGADLVAGSLIKNIGGGIAPTGGYIAGKKQYISLIENRLTAPSLGGEVGSYAFTYQYFYQGVFIAPHVVAQSLKGSLLFAKIFEKTGFETSPKSGNVPADITRAVKFNDKDKLIAFINAIQSVSPVDSFLKVEPWDMPGYSEQVIMAAGCFVQGSSIELSADAPIKEPYIAYIQGGITYEHCKAAAYAALSNLN